MSAAMALGGFTGPEADTLGYAIRKKKSAVLRAQKEKFVTQAAERGVAPKVIDAVFTAFEPFERYGFNKAHATCYGLIAYQTAYLKANYTVEYMTSVLTAFRSNEEKVAAAVAECRRLGIEVLPPDVHTQPSRVHRRGRRDPLRAAGGQERRPGRHRVDHRRARRGRAVPLADRLLHPDRPAPVQPQGPRGAHQGRRAQRVRPSGPAPARARRRDRRGPGDPARPDHRPDVAVRPGRRGRRGLRAAAPRRRPRCPMRERLRWEKELLGLYLSEHPMGEVAEQVGQFVNAYSGDLQGRVARRPADRGRRDRDRHPDGHHQAQGDDGDRDASRTCRGRSRSWSSRACTRRPADLARRRDPARRRPRRPPRRGGRRCSPTSSLDWDDAVARGPGGVRPGRGRGRPRRAAGGGNGRERERRTATGTASGRGRWCAVGPGCRAGPGRRGGRRSASRRPVAVRLAAPRRRGGGVSDVGDPACRRSPRPSRSPTYIEAARRRRRSRPTATRTRGARRGARADRGRRRPPTPRSTPARTRPARPVRRVGRHRIAWSSAMEPFKTLLRDRPGATRVVIHVPATGRGRRSRWSCAGASPTTPSCSPRSIAGSATGSWSCGSPRPERGPGRGRGRRLDGQSVPATRRTSWTAESFSWNSARIALTVAGSRSSSRAISLSTALSSAEIVPLAARDREARPQDADPLLARSRGCGTRGSRRSPRCRRRSSPGAWPSRPRGWRSARRWPRAPGARSRSPRSPRR